MRSCLMLIQRIVLVVHFALIVLYLTTDHVGQIIHLKPAEKYVSLFFEQDWGMFSNLPKGNVTFLIGYPNKNGTNRWYDVTTPLYKRNAFLLSIDQRLSKYLDGVIQGTISKHNEALIASKNITDSIERKKFVEQYIKNSYSYKSLVEYSKMVFRKNDLKYDSETVVTFKFVYQPLIPFKERNKKESPVLREITLPPTYVLR